MAKSLFSVLFWLRFGDVSNDADTMARKLISVTSELDSTQGALKVRLGHVIVNSADLSTHRQGCGSGFAFIFPSGSGSKGNIFLEKN